MKFVAPSTSETAFNCPHCSAFAHQSWMAIGASPILNSPIAFLKTYNKELAAFDSSETSTSGTRVPKLTQNTINANRILDVWAAYCANCNDLSIWENDNMIFPATGNAPTPNPDLPEKVRKNYAEAAAIASSSPRGAAALLRLCIEELCKEIGDPEKSINANIKQLVENGLDQRIQKALDTVRVIGNDAVHGGEIKLDDDSQVVSSLFQLINLIAEKMITEPKHIDQLYNQLPKNKLESIENRDK